MACGCGGKKNPVSQPVPVDQSNVIKSADAAKFRMKVITERQETCKTCEFSTKTEVKPGIFIIGKDSKCLKNNTLLMPEILKIIKNCPENKWEN